MYEGLKVAGIILNNPTPPGEDPSIQSNLQEIASRTTVPVLAEVLWNATNFDGRLNWFGLAQEQ